MGDASTTGVRPPRATLRRRGHGTRPVILRTLLIAVVLQTQFPLALSLSPSTLTTEKLGGQPVLERTVRYNVDTGTGDTVPPPPHGQGAQFAPAGTAAEKYGATEPVCLAAALPTKDGGVLGLSSCGSQPAVPAATQWIEGLDPRGNPQVASVAADEGLCVNDRDVACTQGNQIILHQCQLANPNAHLNVANHFAYINGTLRALFCTDGPPMCILAHTDNSSVDLGDCIAPEAQWSRQLAPLPPSPPPPPPVPPIPPPPPVPPGKPCMDCPNIVFVLTDDQDSVLGGGFPATSANGATPMPQTKRLLMEGGAMATNFYIHTPICCPSRSETLTGRYLHNVKLPVAEKQCTGGYAGVDAFGNVCCMHVDEALVNNNTLAKYLKIQAGYRVGMFGKYLNNCPNAMQPGFDAWFANGGGSYYAPQFATQNIDGLPDGGVTFNKTQYSTALIGNYSLEWIKKVATDGSKLPWMAYIGTKACHDPFQPSPWYADVWDAEWPAHAPRPPSFNVSQATLAQHHPTISSRPPFTNATATCIDGYFKDRWRTLMSVDDIIGATVALVDELGQTNNTYFLFTSDHGYSLGELNLNWDKRNVYEFDVKIHLLIRGPGIAPGSTFNQVLSNVDLAPSMLSLAGLGTVGMDGRSFIPLAIDPDDTTSLPGSVQRYMKAQPSRELATAGWRTSHFIEYYYVGIGGDCGMAPIELADNNFIALRVINESANLLYAEFQSGTDGNVPFNAIEHYELFDMNADPWQMKNLYSTADPELLSALHSEVQQRLHCQGASCP